MYRVRPSAVQGWIEEQGAGGAGGGGGQSSKELAAKLVRATEEAAKLSQKLEEAERRLAVSSWAARRGWG